uniref:Uncharacterized protein n=1 Tax=Corynebacterium silvaticum TaxID=2320431 RepID=A0A7U5HN22_9CORY
MIEGLNAYSVCFASEFTVKLLSFYTNLKVAYTGSPQRKLEQSPLNRPPNRLVLKFLTFKTLAQYRNCDIND